MERWRWRAADTFRMGCDPNPHSHTREGGRFMEAATSSHYVIGGAHALAYFCKLCRAEMPFEQRAAHNRGIHSDLYEQQQRAYARNMRIVIIAVVGSGAGFFLGLFVPAAILGIDVPIWYIVAIFIAMFA